VKLVVIGGGSSYTPELMEGLIAEIRSLPLRELYLVDIPPGQDKLEAVAGLCDRMLQKAGLAGTVKLRATLRRREALGGADFVISQFRAGGLQARVNDELLPLAYGIVGQETTGPGGFAQALRAIPEALALAREMEELCPEAWLINFTNPSGVVTEALQRYSAIKTVGLCNIPAIMRKTLAAFLEAPPHQLALHFTGLNHLSFVTRVTLAGNDIIARILPEPAAHFFAAASPALDPTEVSRLIGHLGLLPSPYLRYYYFPRQTFDEALKQARGPGTRAQQIMAFEKELLQRYRDPELNQKPPELSFRGGACYSEAAVSLMVSLCGGGPGEHVLNVRNDGAIPDLPARAVVETNCLVEKDAIRVLEAGPLPAAVRGLVQQVKAYEELTVEAAAEGDYRKAYQALLNHPLVRGADTARALLEEIINKNRPFLPQFGGYR